jgi:predicted GNAT family acetyltransferase
MERTLRLIGDKTESAIKKKIQQFISKNFSTGTARVNFTYGTVSGLEIEVEVRGRNFASFKLKEMSGCCAHLVAYNLRVDHSYSGRGLGQFLTGLCEEIAESAGYSNLYATSTTANTIQNHIFQKLGWKEVDRVVNKRTNNTVITWKKEL